MAWLLGWRESEEERKEAAITANEKEKLRAQLDVSRLEREIATLRGFRTETEAQKLEVATQVVVKQKQIASFRKIIGNIEQRSIALRQAANPQQSMDDLRLLAEIEAKAARKVDPHVVASLKMKREKAKDTLTTATDMINDTFNEDPEIGLNEFEREDIEEQIKKEMQAPTEVPELLFQLPPPIQQNPGDPPQPLLSQTQEKRVKIAVPTFVPMSQPSPLPTPKEDEINDDFIQRFQALTMYTTAQSSSR
jgi:hypothetical protein